MFVSMEKEKSNTAASSEAIGRDERKTCKICSQLSVNPRSLKCNHFFCEECLLTYLQNLEQETELKVTFPCPVCQQTNPYSEGKVSLKWIRQLPEPIGVNEMTEKKLDLCSPCDSTGESHPAARYCIDCDELLCKTCVDYHMKFKSSKAHNLVHCNKEDIFKGAQLLSSYLVCPSHNDKAVEVKCEVHNDLCCLTCATITHRNCQSISEIRQLAAGCKTNGQTDTLRTRIEGVNCCIEEIISANDTCRKEFDTSLEEIPKTLEQIKANLMKLYDNIEACVLDKVKDIRLDESVTTENRKEKWSNKLSANVDLLKMIDAILEVGTDSQVYVAVHKVKQILEENEKALADQGSHIVGQSLQLNVTEKLECILKTAYFQSLVCVESVQSQHQLLKVSEYSNNSAQDELMLASDTLQELEIEEFPPVIINDDSMPISPEAAPVPEHATSKKEATYPIPRRRGPQEQLQPSSLQGASMSIPRTPMPQFPRTPEARESIMNQMNQLHQSPGQYGFGTQGPALPGHMCQYGYYIGSPARPAAQNTPPKVFSEFSFTSTPKITEPKIEEQPKPPVSTAPEPKPFSGFSFTLPPKKTTTASVTMTPVAQNTPPKVFSGLSFTSTPKITEPKIEKKQPKPPVSTEEDEEKLFSERTKLFRFDDEAKQWKERGIGELKILQHKVSKKVRILLRREQVLKVCANHTIKKDMKLTPMSSSDKAWCWSANDYADGEMKHERLAAKFENTDIAGKFKEIFEECQKALSSAEGQAETGTKV